MFEISKPILFALDSQGLPVYYQKGTNVMVIKSFNQELYACINEQIYVLECLPKHQLSSKAFDLAVAPTKPRKRYIPPMNHPWKQASFERYMQKQKHRTEIA